jgi:23S rRNA (cytosine1962-C5)-methyltransferase
MLSFGKDAPCDEGLEVAVERAVARRVDHPLLEGTDAVRLVNAEGDGLPGLVVDRYADTVVARLTSAGMEARRDRIASALRQATGATRGFERADGAAARREGVAAREGPLWGEAPAGAIAIDERGRRFEVDVRQGQKTGFYLDQRDARDLVERMAAGRRVLDLFGYTGGFALAAARGGAAAVTGVDSSADALARARAHLAAGAPGVACRFEKADAFRFLRGHEEPWDAIVVDPPPLARHRRDAPRAARAYKDLLLHALRRVEAGGWVLAFSCSHHVGPALFRKIAFGASLDAARPAQVLRELSAPADHPVSLDHPEGAYLHGLLLQVV